MHNENSDSIAIIGMACRFPGAKNIEEFWQNLCEGKEAITFFSKEEFKSSHPDDVLASPILENVDHFDAEFFEYSPKEARMMDPQHRLLLEVAWHAFEDAGYNPENYSDPIGSFTGSGGVVSSYLLDRMQHINDILGPTGSLEHLGNDKDFLSTRLAYKLNLTGPSLNVQTACSTSLVALHLACQSLLANECKMALVGASTIRFPHRTGYKYSKGDILSPDGHCRPFDAEAQGTLFGSGVAAIIIKPLKAAIADKDHIYAVIKSTAINNDGAHKMSYTASSVDGQAKAMKQAFSKAKISPDQIGYVECHGTGTIVGDPLEINALNRAFNPREKPSQYCPIGSVKGNIGHLEQTAGLAALIKTALILKNGLIPPSINYKNPNPKIPFAKTPFYVNTQLQQWSEQNPRIAGVNSLGLGGTNAFAILQEAPHLNEAHFPTSLAMLNLSAKTSAALSELKNFYLHYLNQNQDLNLQKICYTASVGRLHSTYRDSYLVNTVDDLKAKLSNDLQNPMMKNDGSPAVVFLFTGQGSQYINMAREIYLSQPVFHDALNLCDKLLRPYLDIPLLSLLYDKNNQHLLNETRYTQPVLFSLEYSLAMLWQSWGIQPAAVMGHSVGEYVAACIAGVFSLEDGLFLISERAKLMDQLTRVGTMAAIMASEDIVTSLIDKEKVNIAATNSPINTVISGVRESVLSVVEICKNKGLMAEELHVSHAFHSFLLEPILHSFEESLKKIHFRAPNIRWISNLTGNVMLNAPDIHYWRQHARQPVRFYEGFLQLEKLGFNTFLEIGPGKTLLGIGKTIFPHDKTWLASLNKKGSDSEQLLTTLRQLYLLGSSIHWESYYKTLEAGRVSLPLYPFQRKRYWLGSEPEINIAKRSSFHPFVATINDSTEQLKWELDFDLNRLSYLNDHCMFDMPTLPTTAALEIFTAAGKALLATDKLIVENLIYKRAINLKSHGEAPYLLIQKPMDSKINAVINVGDINHLQAQIILNTDSVMESFSLENIKNNCQQKVNTENFYSYIGKLGLNYGPDFRKIKHLFLGKDSALSRVEIESFPAEYSLYPAFLDACLHVYPALVDEYRDLSTLEDKVYLPVSIEKFISWQELNKSAWVYAEKVEVTAQGFLVVDIHILDDESNLIAQFKKLTLRKLSSQDLQPSHVTVENSRLEQWKKLLVSTEDDHQIKNILTEMIIQLLELDEIDDRRPLNELGLDSLIAIQLLNQIEEVFKKRIAVTKIIQGATLVGLVSEINGSAMEDQTDIHSEKQWLVFYKNKPDAKARLFCFPYAGGGPQVFKDWAADDVEIGVLQLPGRGARFNESSMSSIVAIAESVVEAMLPYLDKPYALFGHSMGGLVLYEVVLQLKRRHLRLPQHLFPAGIAAPHLHRLRNYHEFTDEEFITLLQETNYSGTQLLLENVELRKLMLPIVRSDLATAIHYPRERQADIPQFDIPITAFAGEIDSIVPERDVHEWKSYTNQHFKIYTYPYNHYFIETEHHKIIKIISNTLLETA